MSFLPILASCSLPQAAEMAHMQKVLLARTKKKHKISFPPLLPNTKASVLQELMGPKKEVDSTSSTTGLIQPQFLIYQCQPLWLSSLFLSVFCLCFAPSALISWTSVIQTRTHDSFVTKSLYIFTFVTLFILFFFSSLKHQADSFCVDNRGFRCLAWTSAPFTISHRPLDLCIPVLEGFAFFCHIAVVKPTR